MIKIYRLIEVIMKVDDDISEAQVKTYLETLSQVQGVTSCNRGPCVLETTFEGKVYTRTEPDVVEG